MPKKKNQHYVPRTYLRRFSASEASIRLCNLDSGRIVDTAPIKGQCSRDYMYGRTPEREDALATIEGIAKTTLDTVISSGRLPVHYSGHWSTILIFLAIQYGRTAYTADAMNDIVHKHAEHLMGHEPKLKEFFDAGGRVGINDGAALGVQLALEMYPLLSDLRWVLLRAAPKTQFITSDVPVVFYNQAFEGRHPGSLTGWASTGLQCFLPISPNYTLLLFDSSIYRVKPGELRQASRQDVDTLNLLQCANAYENVYFRDTTREDILSLRARALRLRRKEKMQLKVQEEGALEGGGKKQLLVSTRTEVKIGLRLSFMDMSKAGANWVDAFLRLRPRPVVAIRNERLHDELRRFDQAVDEGAYQRGDFWRFHADQRRM